MSESKKPAKVFRHYFDDPKHSEELEQYKNDRELFNGSTGIICPIRAIVFRNGKGIKTSNAKTNDFYKTIMDSLYISLKFFHNSSDTNEPTIVRDDVLAPNDYIDFFKSISSVIGYFAACSVSDMSVKLTYSLCAWPDIVKFDADYGKYLAIKRALDYNLKPGDVGTLEELAKNNRSSVSTYQCEFDSPDLFRVPLEGELATEYYNKVIVNRSKKSEPTTLPNVVFYATIREQLIEFLKRCKKVYKDRDIPLCTQILK